jgi:hypothetical protein
MFVNRRLWTDDRRQKAAEVKDLAKNFYLKIYKDHDKLRSVPLRADSFFVKF